MLEKPKSGEISDVARRKVGDRGATAGCLTSYFHDSLYRLGWIVIRKSLQIELLSCIIVLPYRGACFLLSLRGTQLLAESSKCRALRLFVSPAPTRLDTGLLVNLRIVYLLIQVTQMA